MGSLLCFLSTVDLLLLHRLEKICETLGYELKYVQSCNPVFELAIKSSSCRKRPFSSDPRHSPSKRCCVFNEQGEYGSPTETHCKSCHPLGGINKITKRGYYVSFQWRRRQPTQISMLAGISGPKARTNFIDAKFLSWSIYYTANYG